MLWFQKIGVSLNRIYVLPEKNWDKNNSVTIFTYWNTRKHVEKAENELAYASLYTEKHTHSFPKDKNLKRKDLYSLHSRIYLLLLHSFLSESRGPLTVSYKHKSKVQNLHRKGSKCSSLKWSHESEQEPNNAKDRKLSASWYSIRSVKTSIFYTLFTPSLIYESTKTQVILTLLPVKTLSLNSGQNS